MDRHFRPAALSLLLIVLFASACLGASSDPDRIDIPPTYTLVTLDEICSQLINQPFQTREAYEVGVDANGPVFQPLLVSFLQDGRVAWVYEFQEAQFGVFTCQQGTIEAVFETGTRSSFSARYDPIRLSVTIDGLEYFLVQDT